VINVPKWLRYIALDSLLMNNETGLNLGQGDDYFLYRGVADPRFVLIPHDLYTILDRGGGTTRSIFSIVRGTGSTNGVDGLKRFFDTPRSCPLPRPCWSCSRVLQRDARSAVRSVLGAMLQPHRRYEANHPPARPRGARGIPAAYHQQHAARGKRISANGGAERDPHRDGERPSDPVGARQRAAGEVVAPGRDLAVRGNVGTGRDAGKRRLGVEVPR
jgi:hypothetical protein